jgi:L-lactate dehydrogenase complex protein LldF
MINHSEAAAIFNANEERVNWHDKSLWFVRQKRDSAALKVKGWEDLRELASEIKAHTLSKLDEYLIQFEKQAIKNGVKVHWATDAEEHNKIVFEILNEHNTKNVVKSKSMLTEECGLNHYLDKKGIDIVDTDLGERIVQLAKEPPSHIVMPAIHKKREEIDELFHRHLKTELSGGDEVYLTREARKHLRQKFLDADAAITGVNFAVAETGTIVVCTNEGNADMGVHSTKLHIACMGIEKIIPSQEHLGIFLRLLARSATGQSITAYTSHFRSPKPGNELHIIIVDNGRSNHLGKPDFRTSLHCIRCGACMNTCPVYRRSGGHSYNATIPGPIGSILFPGFNLSKYSSLAFASSLCGSCSDVCPVKIDIHSQLYNWRQVITKELHKDKLKRFVMIIASYIFAHPLVFRFSGKLANLSLRVLPRTITDSLIKGWTRERMLPEVPENTFTGWYKKNRMK